MTRQAQTDVALPCLHQRALLKVLAPRTCYSRVPQAQRPPGRMHDFNPECRGWPANAEEKLLLAPPAPM